jgi:uncharacterized protein YbjQ (UPF0145 family)
MSLAAICLAQSLPTSLPVSFDLQDPLVRRIVLAAAALVLLVILLRIAGRWREARAAARRRAELRRQYESVRLEQAEIARLAQEIVATSSTARIAGYAILRQVETVFGDGKPSSGAAAELVKALAAQKGANALINLQTRQMATGKWVASGDAVVVKLIGRRGEEKM